jgi:tRNA threonylcarbamoyladenosine biosynthesis protein TsaE
LVNEYETQEGETLYHFDFYRIKNQEEAFDMGAEDYFYSGDYCFIEWAEKIPDLIPDNHNNIKIIALNEHTRKIFLE